jgi:FkbM family methyltransferase
LDLGANLGGFSNYIASRYQCRVFAVEASPTLFAQLDTAPLVRKFNYAACGNNTTISFYESTKIEAGNTVGPKSNSTGKVFEVKARSLAALASEFGIETIDLLKVDIEGAEVDLFDEVRAQTLKNVKQLTIEFHDSVPIPNVSKEDVERIIKKIASIGFTKVSMGDQNSDWLFMNRKHIHLNRPTRFYLRNRRYLTDQLQRIARRLGH